MFEPPRGTYNLLAQILNSFMVSICTHTHGPGFTSSRIRHLLAVVPNLLLLIIMYSEDMLDWPPDNKSKPFNFKI